MIKHIKVDLFERDIINCNFTDIIFNFRIISSHYSANSFGWLFFEGFTIVTSWISF